MKIKDIMSYNVVTTPSKTGIREAMRIMEAHHISRLPVVDKNKLVGIVTSRMLERASPSKATSLSIWELSYLMEKTPISEVMEKDVFTVGPDDDVEQVLAVAQQRKVGSAVVEKDGAIVGIVTNTDFLNKIINPLLGIGMPGYRLEVTNGIMMNKGPGQLEKLMVLLRKYDFKIINIHIEGAPEELAHDVCFHIIDGHDIDQLIKDFSDQGFPSRIRNR